MPRRPGPRRKDAVARRCRRCDECVGYPELEPALYLSRSQMFDERSGVARNVGDAAEHRAHRSPANTISPFCPRAKPRCFFFSLVPLLEDQSHQHPQALRPR